MLAEYPKLLLKALKDESTLSEEITISRQGHYQRRIQDFPEVGAPTLNVDVKSYHLANLTPKRVPGIPPLRSANDFY